MIVGIDDFKVEAHIPGLFPLDEMSPSSSVISERVQSFIDRYEQLFLYKFFGNEPDRVTELINYFYGTEMDDEEKNKLLCALKSPIADYVAYHYFRSETIVNTTIGGVVEHGENGNKSSTIDLCTRLWNDMCEQSRYIYTAIIKNECPNTEVFKYVNAMNL